MTELEWLKQESGLDEAELKAMEAVAGHTKFVGMLQKLIGSSEQATKDKATAEQARLDLEKRYNDEFIPEMRKVTQDALRAQGEAARMKAQLEAAKQYGIVPEDDKTTVVEPPRAPGSPDPNAVSREDLNRFSSAQSNTLIALQDLNAEHFRLFGQPLGNTQELVDEVQKQRTLGQKNFTLKQAWETKHNVQQKRDELSKAERQKEIDTAIAADRKIQAEKMGANPNTRSGQPSRYANYKPSDASKEPWKAPHQKSQANKPWREKAVAAVREFAA